MNKAFLIGRLTKDVDLRYTSSGKAMARFILAVDRPYKDENGEHQADFILVVVWGNMAQNCADYILKGSLVGVIGSIRTRSYDNEGKRRYITEVAAEEVQFLDRRKKDTQEEEQYPDYEPF